MKRPGWLALAVLLAPLGLGAVPDGSYVITGALVADGSGGPLRRANVRVSCAAAPWSISGATAWRASSTP